MTTVIEKSTIKQAIWTIKSASKYTPDYNLGYKLLTKVWREMFELDLDETEEGKKIGEMIDNAKKYKNIFPNQVEEIAEYIMQNDSLFSIASEIIDNA